ncbi:hypothetical protein [Sphingobium abikonense]|uniref:hypothetical protein n=1 Tax=Sphingobium abikonense TaxID=86193 RepID=UPI003516535C
MTLAALIASAQAAANAPLDEAVALIRPFLHDIGWFGAWLTDQIAGMRVDPLHLPPVRASSNGAVRHLVFVRTERIWVTATIIDLSAPPSDRLHFSGRHALCRPLNKPLRGELFQIEEVRPAHIRTIDCEPGKMLELDERHQALRLTPGAGALMMLRAQIAPRGPVLARTIDLASGGMTAQAQVDEAHARTLMLLSLLRMQRRRDAAPMFAAALDAPLPAQRWAVMREYLALDTAQALEPLTVMARADADGNVKALARQTLARLEQPQCRA